MLNKEDFLQKFDQLARKARRIAVVGHLKPDSDAVATIIGLCAYLRTAYKQAYALPVLESGFISVFSTLPGADQIVWSTDLHNDIKDFDLAIFVDSPDAKRFFRNNPHWPTHCPSVCIDHHGIEVEPGALAYVDGTAMASAQIILELFAKEEDYTGKAWLNKDIASVLLYGIIGDSGTFRYVRAFKARVLSVAQKLLEAFDLDIGQIDDMFNTHQKDTLIFLAKLLERTVYVDKEDGKSFMYCFATAEDLAAYSLPVVKMAVEQYRYRFLRQVSGYNWGFIVNLESKDTISVSFRAKADTIDVNYLAGILGGGGHNTASAAKFRIDDQLQTVDDVVKLVLNTIEKNII